MKKRCTGTLLTMLCFVFFAVFLSACAPSLSESAITEMLTENADDFLQNPDEEITSIEITKRDANEEAKAEEVWFTVASNDEEAEYLRYFIAGFKLYDKGGWQYEIAVPDPKEKPSATPIAGVSDEMVKELIAAQGLKTPIAIGDDNWQANSNTIKSVAIGTHNTQLGQKKDTVTVEIVLEDIVQTATGEAELTFVYDNGWQYQDYTVSTPFTVAPLPGTEKDLTAEDFVALITSQDAVNLLGQQTRIAADEILDVTLVKSSITNKGTQQFYEYSYHLNKAQGRMVFAMTVQVEYQYSDGWQAPTIDFTDTKLTLLDLAGTWTGTGAGSGIHAAWFDQRSIGVSFEIAEEGATLENIMVTLENPSAEAFMKVIVDPKNLNVTLAFTEWTQEPFDVERLNGLLTLTGVLNIDDFSISINNGEMYDLTLTQG